LDVTGQSVSSFERPLFQQLNIEKQWLENVHAEGHTLMCDGKDSGS